MDSKKDAYGQEVLAYYNKRDAYEIVERDDGFIDFSRGPPAYFAEFKNWPEIDKKAIKHIKGKILDIGAGAGRNSLYLQKKGFDVVAIDNSPLAIKVCKKRGVKKAKIIGIEQINKLKPNKFNTIIMFGSNFGLFGDFKKAKKILKEFHEITTPDARIIAESNDVSQTKIPEHLEYHKLNKKRGRMPGQLRIRIRFKKYISDWFDYLLASKKEVKEIVKNTGWKIERFIESKKSNYFIILKKE